MRLLVLITLIGIAAARCPLSNKRCFNQLINQMQNGQGMNDFDQDIDDQYDTQQQQCQCYNGYCQCDNDQDDQEQEEYQCETGDIQCYIQQQQQGNQQQQSCNPQYNLIHQLQQPNAQLAAKLYKQAKQEQDDKNTVVSPAALQLTLAALQKGAKGNTKQQIKRVQCPKLNQQQCEQANAALIRSLKGTNQVQQTQKTGQSTYGRQQAKINIPTAIIVNQNTSPRPNFIQHTQQCLGGQVKQCSFKTNPQQCRQQINQLVAQKTNGKCRNTVPKQAVTTNTKMIAVNAFQMQAKFNEQFRQQQTTKQGRFQPLGSQQTKSCQMIQSQARLNYYEDENCKVVGIPTQQQELTLYLIVPKQKQGLTQVEKEKVQNGQQLKEILNACDQQKQYVQVQMPKFQAKTKLDTKQTLLKQGIQAAFDNDQADFTQITGQSQDMQQLQGQKTHLNKVIQQATIKVTSQGITAANSNNQFEQQDIQDEWEQMLQQQQQNQYDQQNQYGIGTQVNANRAFAFVVKHNPTNQIVLVGRVVDPTQKPQGQQQQNEYNYNQNDEDQNDYDDNDQE